MQKKIFILSIILLTAASFITYSYIHRHTKKLITPPYETIKPVTKNITQFISASGTLKAQEHLLVGTLAPGLVDKILVEDNDMVKKGQLLAVLNDGIGDLALKKAQALLKQAQAQADFQKKFYTRQQALHKAGHIADNLFENFTQEYHTALAKVAELEASVAIEENNYNNLFIKSPDDGVIIAKKISLGQMVSPQLEGMILFDVAKDLSYMEVHADVDEADIGIVKTGQSVRFSVDAFPKKYFYGTVRQILYLSKVVDNTVTYEAIIPVENPELLLRPGMTANIEFKVAAAENTLAIPNKVLRVNSTKLQEWAILTHHPYKKIDLTLEQNNTPEHIDTLWVLENNVLKQKKIKLGANDGAFTQIIEGISPHDTIISAFNEPHTTNPAIKSLFGSSSSVGK